MRFCKLFILAALAALLVACSKKPGPNVAATVNDQAITYDQVDRMYTAVLSSQGERGSDDLATMQKLEILRSLIDREILVQRAEKLGLMATDADVDAELAKRKAGYTDTEFQEQLKTAKMTLADYKNDLRRDLSVEKLINKEIGSKVSLTDQEITDYYNTNKASFNHPEPSIHLARIVVTAAPDANVRNLKNDKAQNDEQARKKAQMLAARIQQGEDFSMLAESYSEDPNTIANGGDLGSVPLSAFEQVPPEVRKLLMSMQPGQVSPIVAGKGDYQIYKVISREPAGQRDLNDPRVQQEIRQTLHNRKVQLLRSAYFDVARNEAKVTNYFARKVVEERGK